ncbi:chlamydia polymorphic membrane middle domain protein, partial [Chlamydia psittaci 04DC42]
SI